MPARSVKEKVRDSLRGRAESFALFPRTFVIDDAYTTNAPSLSLMRNFYL